MGKSQMGKFGAVKSGVKCESYNEPVEKSNDDTNIFS